MIPMIGLSYSLTCLVSPVAESLQSYKTYEWKKGNTILTEHTMAILDLLPLRTSDAGSYSCMVTIQSAYLNGNIIALSQSHDVNLMSE